MEKFHFIKNINFEFMCATEMIKLKKFVYNTGWMYFIKKFYFTISSFGFEFYGDEATDFIRIVLTIRVAINRDLLMKLFWSF